MKKWLALLLALCMTLSLAACGDDKPAEPAAPANTPAQSAETPSGGTSGGAVSGEEFDTGNFKVLVPEGWKAFPQHDVFSDDPNEMNPNILQIGKGASSDMDLYSKPAITINYAGKSVSMMEPSKDFYDDVVDMADVTTGSHTWKAFQCSSMGQKLYMLFEDLGKIQFQAAVTYETDNGKISLDDADVQAILSSIAVTNAEDAAELGASAAPSGNTAEAAADYSFWEGDWYGWWLLMNGTGIYEPASKIGWDAYAEIEVDNKGVGHIRLWDTGTTKDSPLLFGYTHFDFDSNSKGRMVSDKVNFFPNGVWNGGSKAVEADLVPGGWDCDPDNTTVSKFDHMIELVGHYDDPSGSGDGFDYYIFMKPWGMEWEDVRTGDTTGCVASDMMPLYYDNWYKSLLALGYTHPVNFEEGIDIINDYIAKQNAGGEQGGSSGALDPAAKAGADGKVELSVLQEALPKCKKMSYDVTYDEVAAIFGVHGLNKESLFEGKSIYRWWATDKDYIQITFDLHEDGSETWNVTQYSGIN